MSEGHWIVAEGTPVPMQSWARRILWLIMIWSASVTALAVVALLFRILMKAAGLTE